MRLGVYFSTERERFHLRYCPGKFQNSVITCASIIIQPPDMEMPAIRQFLVFPFQTTNRPIVKKRRLEDDVRGLEPTQVRLVFHS